MSFYSMTGHGKGSAAHDGMRVEVEISSVNRKQLDIHVQMPRSWSALESRIQEDIARVISRGRVTGYIAVTWSAKARAGSIAVDHALAGAYLVELRRAARRLDLRDDFSAELLLSLPDVVQHREPVEDLDDVWPVVQRALQRALKSLSSMRRTEGRALQADLEKRLALLEKEIEVIRGHAPSVVERYRKQLAERLRQAGFDEALEEDRLHRELALFADRSDIAEELTRLDSHMNQAHRLMKARDAKGRSLDFLTQEMFREINTIGSKANDAVITRHVITFKAELERLREQIQNVE